VLLCVWRVCGHLNPAPASTTTRAAAATMSSSYFQGTRENTSPPLDGTTSSTFGSSDHHENDVHDHYENLSFFCSLMCFVPWAQVISLHEHEEIPSTDEIILDDYSIHSQGTGDSEISSSSSSSSSNQPPLTLMSLSDSDSNWSVFKSRRRNSGNAIKDFRETPIKVRPKGGHAYRTSPIGVTDHPQYFDLRDH
jgi:hypothetical protein